MTKTYYDYGMLLGKL